ncbi:Endoglucanase 11 [Hordeum vulgare]|nr:Endoglucanase 11 [Hordeum vulgare]
MATEDEAREAADGEEVQVENGHLRTTHLQMNLDSKLSPHGEMKGEATASAMDLTEGMKVSEDQILERAPSAIEIPQEDTPNGTHSSLNDQMKEGKISNEKPQENGQKGNEQVEASPDGISTEQSSASNGKEAIDSLGHVENTAEDTSGLLKHDNEEPKEHCQDVEGDAMEDKMVHEDRLQPDNDVEPTIDAQQGHNLEPAEVTEDTQPATMPSIPGEEVVAEAPAGAQTSQEANVDEPDALPDTSDGNTKTVEPAKVDKENCPEDEDIEVVKLEDQPSAKTDDVDADLVQEEVPKSKKTDVPEDMPKTEQADESTNGDQEVLDQESPKETSDPLHEKTEETSHESNVSTSEETTPEHDAMTREPALDVEEVQEQGLAEETADAKEVDTEKTVQQSGIAFEEATPEDNATITEPSSEIQHLNNVEPEEIKSLEDAKAEETSDQSNVTIAEDGTQDKEATEDIQPVQGLEEEEPKNTGTVEIDEASNQPHADVINNCAEEDDVLACQPQVIELKEVKDTGAIETQEITQQSHAAASEELVTEDNSMAIEPLNDDIQQTLEQRSAEVKHAEVSETQEICHGRTISAPEEDSVEDDVTAEGPTCDAKEVENVASVEEIKDNTAQNIIETSSVATVEEADQENNVLPTEDVSEQQMRGLETEEIQNTEPVDTEEASDQWHPALLNDPAQGDSIPGDVPKTGSTADVKETEALPQESNVSICEEPASEENITANEVTCDDQEGNLEQAEAVESNKDTRIKEISDQSNEVFAREAAQGTSDLAREPAADMQSVQELQSEKKNAELTEVSEACGQMDAAVIENPTHEDNLTTSESLVMESAEVSSNEATEGQEMTQSDATQSEDHKTEENIAVNEPQILEPEPAEEMRDSEATEPRAISQESMSVPEEYVTAKEAASDIKEVHAEELIEKPDDVKAEEISNQSSGAIVGETAQEHKLLSSDPTNDVQAKELESQKIGNSEDVQTEEASHQTHAEENLTENEPQIATEDNTAILTDVSIQQLQEQEPVEFRDTEATEPQGISPSHTAFSSEQSTLEDNEMTEPSPATQAENLESAIVTEESKEVKSTDAIAEEETPKEHVQESEAHVDIPLVENTEPVDVHENVTTNDLPAEEVKENEAIEVAEIYYESPVANIGDLTEDAKSNVALEDEAAPDEDAKATEATAAIPQPQEPELEENKNSEPVEVEDNITARDLPAEEIKDTEAMETEMIPHESTGGNISELINDVKSNIALADEAAPDEHAKATEATGAIPQPQEPNLEEIKNSEPAEVEGNTSASDLPAKNVKDTDAVETEAINDSTDANNSELTEDVQSNVSLTDEAAHDEHVTVAERTVDVPQAQEPKLEEVKNTEPVEVEETRSASDLPAEEMGETEANNESSDANISDLIEDVQNNVALTEEVAPEEHVMAPEATVDIPEAQEPELEETKNTEPAEVAENISANDLPAEEVKDTEAMETETINESTNTNNSELTEDVKNIVALADEAAPEEHVTVADDTVDIPHAQEPEVEEIKNTEPVEVEENISASDLPAEEVNGNEAKETEATNGSTDANFSEIAEDVESNVALADQAAPEEHVIATEATVDIAQAQEPELEEIKNIEPVEVKENISASDMPAEEMKDTEAKETEAFNESIDANISKLTEDVKSNLVCADEAAPEEHVIATAATVDIPRTQEPELEETKNTEPAEVEAYVSENDLPAEEVKDSEAVETEAINESTDANNNELTEDVKSNVALADEAAPEEHVTVADNTVDIPQAQEPEVEEIQNTRPVKVEENIPASDLPAEKVKDTEAINESTDASISELTEDMKSNVTPAEEAAPEEHVIAAEATVDIPQAQVPELKDLENVEPVEVEENRSAGNLPAEEVKETEAINESIDANISELIEDVTSSVNPADEAAHEEHIIATEGTVNIPRAQEPELEEIENTEPVEVEENTSASDIPAEEVKDTEAINESTDANISELTEDMKCNIALTDEAAHKEHVTVAETTVDIPHAQEPELKEIKNTEAGDLPEEEVKETEAISKRTDANISELNEDVKSNVVPADEEPHAEHVTVAETTFDIPQAQEPELEEIKSVEPVEVEENRSASGLQAEVVKETEAINKSPDANISELTEDVTSNVAPADEAAPEEHVIATEAPVDIPRAQELDLEEIKNTEPTEVEENISANELSAEEVKETEAKKTEAINEIADVNISELTEDVRGNVAHADEAAPEEHVMAAEATDDIPEAQVSELQELENAEPVEMEENKSAPDLPAEEVKGTGTMEIEAVKKSTDANISELTEDVGLADKIAPDVQVDIPTTQETALEEIKNTEPVEAEDSISAVNVPAEEINDTEDMQTGEIPRESTDDGLTASAPLLDIQQVPEQEALEEKTCTDTTENQGEPQQSIDPTSAELTPTEEETTVVEHTQDTHVQNASSEPGSDPNLLVQSAHQSELAEDSKGQLVKAEETGQSNGATLGEPTAEDNAANEINQLADSKQEHEGEENKCIDATEGEEASHPCQDPGLEEPVSESDIATVELTSDIQQVNGMDELEQMTATEGINDEEISTQKTEVATLEDPSPTDHGTEPEQNPVELDKENLGNKISNTILADENIKEEVQEPIEQKDESSDLGEKTAFTTQKDESATEEDVVQISGEDTAGTSNNIEQIKEQPKSVTEHDAIKSGDHTNDQDDEQLHNVKLQMQVCERSVDVLTTEQPDEHVQKVNLDQQQKEDEAIEKQKEEIQTDEQKHDDSRADFTTETILEPQSNENDTTKGKDDADVFEAEQTETVATEMLKNEQTLHIPQQSIPSVTDAKVENSMVENSTEIEETTEQEDAPNNTGTLHNDADAEKCKEDEKENTEMDAAAAKISTDKHDGTTDETINEEVKNDLGSPIEKDLQKTSDLAPSNEEMQENDPTAVPQNIESRVHSEEEECINKANDGMQVPQALEEEIVDEVEKKEEIQNEDTDVNHDKTETKPVDEEASGLHSSNSTDTKMDDTMSPSAEMIHGRIDKQPTEIEEVEENKGFSSISEYVVENPKQNDVEQDLSTHPKVVDDKLATKQNGAEVETDSNEEIATGYTASTESIKLGEAIYDKASRADGALSDENLETIEENGRNLEASPAVTATGESINEDNEHHKFDLRAHSAVDRNETEQASELEVTERELFLEKPLPTESEEQEENQITKEQGEENIQEQETGDTEKEENEAEQSDLPVSHFLMNLIMGKESNEPDGNSEFEAEKKQEETAKDDSSLITSEQEESLVPIPTENMVEKELISEKGKHNLEGSEETHDIKLEKDEELNRNTHDLEAPVCQNSVQGETSSELVVPGGSGLITEMETRDIKLGEKATNSVCQEHMEATTQIEEGSLKSNLDDITSPKVSQEEALEEGRTDLHHKHLPENRSSDAVSGQTLLSTEPNMGDEKDFPNNTDDLQSPLSTKREESNESSIIEGESTVEAELENGVDKEEENQQITTTGGATEEQIENMHDISHKGAEAISDEQKGEITEPVMGNEINLVQEKEISAVSECKDEKQSYKFSNSDLDNSEKALEIQLDGSSLHIDQDKQDESAGDQIVMEKNNLLDKSGESNLQMEQETEVAQKSPKESDEGDQNYLAIREPVIKEVNVNETVDSHVQTVNAQSNEEQETFNSQVQKRDLDVASPEEAPEVEENFVQSKPEFSIIEEQSPKKDESNMAGEKTSDEKTKDVQEAKSFTDEAKAKIEEQGAVQKASHNQKHNLDVISPTEAPESEENSVDIKEPEFSTDEEQSPKKDVSNIAEEKSYDKKTNGDEEAKNFADDTPMKIEEREAGQKSSPKKHNILSGVGSKVKHQLAKVKKAIIGKPGHTKSELPKA